IAIRSGADETRLLQTFGEKRDFETFGRLRLCAGWTVCDAGRVARGARLVRRRQAGDGDPVAQSGPVLTPVSEDGPVRSRRSLFRRRESCAVQGVEVGDNVRAIFAVGHGKGHRCAGHRSRWILQIAIEMAIVPGPVFGSQRRRIAEACGGGLTPRNAAQIRASPSRSVIRVAKRALLLEKCVPSRSIAFRSGRMHHATYARAENRGKEYQTLSFIHLARPRKTLARC